MGLKFFKNTFLRKPYFNLWLKDAERKYALIKNHIKKSDKILDLGCGPCSVALVLRKNGYNVVPIDVQDVSFTKKIKPILYDGKTLPFKEKLYNVVFLFNMLHHTKDPVAIIKEAKRVGEKIIIIEDIYENSFEKYLFFVMDTLANFEFFGHPHTNKSDKGWKKVFKDLKLKIIHENHMKFLGCFRQVVYVLESSRT